VPHAILIAFCAAIFLPLLWLARVALTDKATAYKLPPEWVALRLDNFAEIFRQFDFGHAFLNSIIAAVGSTAISPLATCMAYAFARFATGGCRCGSPCWRARCCRR
jgi:ABC-type glycerol-3-phosphate transport system permease component